MSYKDADSWVRIYGPLGSTSRPIKEVDKTTLINMITGQVRYEWLEDSDFDWHGIPK